MKNIKRLLSILLMFSCLVGCTNSNNRSKDIFNELEEKGFQINLLEELDPPRVSVMKNKNDPWIVFCFKDNELVYIQYAEDSENISELEYVLFYNEKYKEVYGINEKAKRAYEDFLKTNNYSQSEMEEFAQYIYNRKFEK